MLGGVKVVLFRTVKINLCICEDPHPSLRVNDDWMDLLGLEGALMSPMGNNRMCRVSVISNPALFAIFFFLFSFGIFLLIVHHLLTDRCRSQ